ncbi:hypothetical protein [Clostridium gasigenes]|uniref:hypothetical protein n=1 Tax=Clostridium gasigenes TaxID=94869 RepID=UPI001C0D0EDE|nr:hypothetical protein [Clostridium gasigenes]MBU3104468.1 hypothetical protein [Clostridium gasigenes]
MKSLDKKPHIVIAMGNCRLKRNIVENLKGDFKFATIVHPTVKISKYVNVGHGTIIYESVVLTVNTTIGNHVIISGNCGIGHDSVIGDYSSILWGARLCGYDALGQEVFLGVGVKIIQGIQINDGIKIDAGVTITRDL